MRLSIAEEAFSIPVAPTLLFNHLYLTVDHMATIKLASESPDPCNAAGAVSPDQLSRFGGRWLLLH